MQQTNIYQSLKNELNEGARPLKRANKEYTDEKNLLVALKWHYPNTARHEKNTFPLLFLYFEETALRFSHAQSVALRAPSRDAVHCRPTVCCSSSKAPHFTVVTSAANFA